MSHPVSTAEYVYQGVRRMMITGELSPGDRLIQRELTQRFGTSNIPVIEAIRRLEQDGLVASRPNAGAFVPQWTKEDIHGIYLMREALEGLACRLFVEYATVKERAQLLEHEQEFHDRVEQQDSRGWLDADIALHQHIVSVTRSRPLIQSAGNSHAITLSILNAHQLRSQLDDISPPSADIHNKLVKTLIGTDPAAAEEAGREHVRGALEIVRQWNNF